MTATTTPTTPTTPTSRSAALASEWIKLTSLRSTWTTLAVGTALAVAISALLAVVVGATWDEWSPSEQADFDPALYPLAGSIFSGIAFAVLGVKVVANEYSSGMIRLTLTATPRRRRVLLAKFAVVVGTTLVATFVSTVAMMLVAQAIFGSYDLETTSLTDGDTLRVVLGLTVTGPLFPLLGAAFAFLLRSSAGAITTVVAAIFAPGVIGAFLPDWWQRNVLAYLPGAAADSLAIGHLDDGSGTTYIRPTLAAVVVVAWAVVIAGVAHLAFTRRDA